MRLAQAARKLSITTEDIVDFLEIRGIVIEKDSNTKLDEKAVKLLYKYFEIEEENNLEEVVTKVDLEPEEPEETKGINQNIKEPDDSEKEEPKEELKVSEEKEEIEDKPDESSVEEKSDKKSFKTVNELLEEDGDNSDNDFVIKAPKVELKGLNVVGKIELPEPKPKPQSEEKEESKIKRTKRSAPKNKENRKTSNRRQKVELSPAEIRKREEQREARKRERIEKEKKKKRELFYKEKILKPKQIEQKNRLKKKKSKIADEPIVQKPKPKTVLGKFWCWLNT
jgi:hypothetical protein